MTDNPPAVGAPTTGTSPPASKRFRVALVGITAVGLAVRLVNVLVLRPTTGPGGDGYVISGDALYYHFQARALAKGLGYIVPLAPDLRPITEGSDLIAPSAAHPPVYSTYLAFWSFLGVDTVTGHRVVSCLLGTATVAVVGLLARRLAPPALANPAGLGAAAVAALYPGLWINDGMLLSESAAILLVTIAVYAAYAFWSRPSLGRACLLGGAVGVAALSRSEVIALFPAVVIPLALLVRDRSWAERVKLAAAGCAVGGLVLAPWFVHNLTRFEEPVLMTSGTGAALSASSCDEVWYGDLIGYYANCFDFQELSRDTQARLCDKVDLPPDCLGTEDGRRAVETSLRDPDLYDESQADQPYAEQARAYTTDHLGRLPIAVAARIGRVWGLYAPRQTTRLDHVIENRGRVPSYLALAGYYVLLPFAVGGVVSMRRRRVPILPVLAVVGVVTFAATITFGVTRYRATVEGIIVAVAAVGGAAAWQWWTGRRSTRESAP